MNCFVDLTLKYEILRSFIGQILQDQSSLHSGKHFLVHINGTVNNVFKIVTKHATAIVYDMHCFYLRRNTSACLFSVYNTISSSLHEQVCLMRLRFERYFSHHRQHK